MDEHLWLLTLERWVVVEWNRGLGVHDSGSIRLGFGARSLEFRL